MSLPGRTYANLASKVLEKIFGSALESSIETTTLSTLFRLLGFTSNINEDEAAGRDTFIKYVRKKGKGINETKLILLRYLQGTKSRIEKWKKDTNVLQINKILRLLGEGAPELTIEPEDTLDVALQKIKKYKKQISNNKDEVGILSTQEAMVTAATEKIDAVVGSLPTEGLGDFGPEIISIIKADSNFLSRNGQQLRSRIRTLEIELSKLQNQGQLINAGVDLSNTNLGKMSLLKVLEVLIYLIEQIKYECGECFYFIEGKCERSGFLNQGTQETVATNSCLEIFNEVDNIYWRLSEDEEKKATAKLSF